MRGSRRGRRPVHLFVFQAEDGIRDTSVTGVQTCALPIYRSAQLRDRPAHRDPRAVLASRLGRADLEGAFRKTPLVSVDHRAGLVRTIDDRAERNEERDEVVGGRMRDARGRRLVLEIDQRVDLAFADGLVRPCVELGRPGRRRLLAHPETCEPQVVRHEATADDEHALLTKRRESTADLEERDRVEARHRDLEHRYVSVRVHLDKGHVRAVIETALRLLADRDRPAGEELADTGGERWRARRRVTHAVVALGKPVEVVDERDRLRGTDRQGSGFPVGRHDEDGLRPRQVPAPRGQLLRPGRVVGERRRAVAEVEDGHHRGGRERLVRGHRVPYSNAPFRPLIPLRTVTFAYRPMSSIHAPPSTTPRSGRTYVPGSSLFTAKVKVAVAPGGTISSV